MPKRAEVTRAVEVWTDESRRLWVAQRSLPWNDQTRALAGEQVAEVSRRTALNHLSANPGLRQANDETIGHHRRRLAQWWNQRTRTAMQWRIVELVDRWAQERRMTVPKALREHYVVQGRGTEPIAREIGINLGTLQKVLQRHGFTIHDQGRRAAQRAGSATEDGQHDPPGLRRSRGRVRQPPDVREG